jgi:hypothetical protein
VPPLAHDPVLIAEGSVRYACKRQMKRASPQTRKMAERLIKSESAISASGDLAPTFSVIDRLRPHLANLMGDGGVRALLARSLVLAAAEASWLQVLHVNADGHFEGLEAIADDLESAVFFDGRVTLLAQLIGLLVALIGPNLSTRLIGEVWPQIPLDERDLGKEHDDE